MPVSVAECSADEDEGEKPDGTDEISEQWWIDGEGGRW